MTATASAMPENAADLRRRALEGHGGVIRRRVLTLAALALLLAASFVLDLMTGPAQLPLNDVVNALFSITGSDGAASAIIWQVRMPTACLAVLIGGCLGLAGAEMQTMLANPLASPFTLGISSAAAFGAALAIVVGVSLPFIPAGFAVPANAFVFSLLTILLIQLIANRQSGGAPLVLFGIAMVFAFGALVSALQFIATADSLQQLVFWTMGSLTRADGFSVSVLAVALIVILPFSMRAARALTLLELGEERAESLGISIRHLRFGCLLRASLLAAFAVSFAGTIGFVGLAGPHVSRMLIGGDHRFHLPASVLCGGIIMSLSSIASKIILPGVLLPIGIVTTLVGLPFFVILLMRAR